MSSEITNTPADRMHWSVELIATDEEGVAFYLKHYRALRLLSLQVDASSFGSTYQREIAFSDERWRDRLLDPAARTFAAIRSGSREILSIMTIRNNLPLPTGLPQQYPGPLMHWHVTGVFTRPEARRQGIAAAVMKTGTQYAVQAAASESKNALLTVDVFTDNGSAKSHYEKAGFVVYNEGSDDGRPTAELALFVSTLSGIK